MDPPTVILPEQIEAAKRQLLKSKDADKISEEQCSKCTKDCACKNVRGLCMLADIKK